AREDFAKRYAAGHPIAVTELLYPLLQAYDSVMIESDVEFGGIDQKFNCLMGRELQQMVGQRPQQVFFTPLLVGTDGKMKMSKSLDNYIGVDEPPGEMYGKVMSLPDNLIADYFELVTDVPDEEIAEFRRQMESNSVNPMVLKKRLAREIVGEFHGNGAAQEAEAQFSDIFQKRGIPEDIPVFAVRTGQGPVDLIEILVNAGAVQSKGEAKRLFAQNAIEIDGNKITEALVPLKDGTVIKVGKRRFVKIVNADKQK
ncbi:MAG: tyrosine--tRNA ligase, partial [Chloroflexi bacterium]|nr:tyrosine--tRNA ligase [Chloroflexota bacterium]